MATANPIHDFSKLNGVDGYTGGGGRNGHSYYDSQSKRTSLVSSAADQYETAPTTPILSRTSLSSSSVNTIPGNIPRSESPSGVESQRTPTKNRENGDHRPGSVNPIHTLSQTSSAEAHIVKVTSNRVIIEEGPRRSLL